MEAIQESNLSEYEQAIPIVVELLRKAQHAENEARELRRDLNELREGVNTNSAIIRQAKQAFVSDLGLSTLFADVERIGEKLYGDSRTRIALNDAINQCKAEIEEVKALKIMNGEIEGKNEAERNARMTIALTRDAVYIEAKGQLENTTSEIARLDADIERYRNQITAIRYSIRAKTAMLEYLAAE